MKRYAIADSHGVIDKSHRVLFLSMNEAIGYLCDAGLFGDYMLGTVKVAAVTVVA